MEEPPFTSQDFGFVYLNFFKKSIMFIYTVLWVGVRWGGLGWVGGGGGMYVHVRLLEYFLF